MDEWQADSALINRVDAELADWQQGDTATPGLIVHLARSDAPLTPETAGSAEGGVAAAVAVTSEFDATVVTSQTCDVRRSAGDRPFVHVSPLVKLEDPTLTAAQARRIPRYVAVPGEGDDAFVDLDRSTTIEKSVLVGLDRNRGCSTDKEIKQFGQGVARYYGRYAFPDDMAKSFSPLRNRLGSKAGKDESAQGRRIGELRQIRTQARDDWTTPVQVELIFIVDASVLPPVSPDDPPSDEITAWLDGSPALNEVAERLDEELTPADRSLCWQRLAELWSALCKPCGVITEITAQVNTADEFTLAEMLQTEELDLDNLTKS